MKTASMKTNRAKADTRGSSCGRERNHGSNNRDTYFPEHDRTP
jgi:hypothetical protein